MRMRWATATNQTFWIRMRPEPFSRHASTRSGGVPASAQRPRGCPRCRPRLPAAALAARRPALVTPASSPARCHTSQAGEPGVAASLHVATCPPKRRCRAAAARPFSRGRLTATSPAAAGPPVVRRRRRRPFSPSINAAVDDDRPTRKRREMPWSDKQAGRARSAMTLPPPALPGCPPPAVAAGENGCADVPGRGRPGQEEYIAVGLGLPINDADATQSK